MAKAKGSNGIVVPTIDMVAAPRGYNAWQAPSTPSAAALALLPTDGTRGLLQELRQAQTRVANNAALYGPTATRTVTDMGWHDRTVAKCMGAYAVLLTGQRAGTAAHATVRAAMASTLANAATLTGYGTANAVAPAGVAAFAAAQRAAATAKPATPAKPRMGKATATARAARAAKPARTVASVPSGAAKPVARAKPANAPAPTPSVAPSTATPNA